jgi:hypothetical protein
MTFGRIYLTSSPYFDGLRAFGSDVGPERIDQLPLSYVVRSSAGNESDTNKRNALARNGVRHRLIGNSLV